MDRRFSLAIHGGAGALKPGTYTDAEYQQYQESLTRILNKGIELLQSGGTALDVAVKLCVLLEDDPLFNAGKGSVFNSEGEIEMDASLMEGHTQRAGGVTGIRRIKNPILAANAVLQSSPHSLLSGASAERFCSEFKLETAPIDYFKTDKRYQQFLKAKEKNRIQMDHDDSGSTIGAVVLDQHGHLAAATSTGGMTNKYPGRVSDSAIIGAGNYADELCAISGTGTGDQFILGSITHLVAIKRQSMSLQEACDFALQRLAALRGNGGLIAVDKEGDVVCPFNSAGMFRASYNGKTEARSVAVY